MNCSSSHQFVMNSFHCFIYFTYLDAKLCVSTPALGTSIAESGDFDGSDAEPSNYTPRSEGDEHLFFSSSSSSSSNDNNNNNNNSNYLEMENIYDSENLLPARQVSGISPQAFINNFHSPSFVAGDNSSTAEDEMTVYNRGGSTSATSATAVDDSERRCDEERLAFFPRHLFADCMCSDGGRMIDCYNSIGTHRLVLPNNSAVRAVRLHKAELGIINNETFNMPTIMALTATFCGLFDIEPGTFNHLTKLESLDLSFNRLPTLHSSIFCFGGSNSNVSSPLQLLNLSNNQLSVLDPSLFSTLLHLTTLDLSNNKLSVITQRFPRLPLLRIIKLGYNFFRIFTADFYLNPLDLPAIEVISAERCDISVVQLGQLGNLPPITIKNESDESASLKGRVILFDFSLNPHLQCTCDLFIMNLRYGSRLLGNCQDTRYIAVQHQQFPQPVSVQIAALNASYICPTAVAMYQHEPLVTGIGNSHIAQKEINASLQTTPTNMLAKRSLHEHHLLLPIDLIPIAVAGMLVAAVVLSMLFSAVVVCSHRRHERIQQQQLFQQQQLTDGQFERTLILDGNQYHRCHHRHHECISSPVATDEEVFYSADLSQTVILIRTMKKPPIDGALTSSSDNNGPNNHQANNADETLTVDSNAIMPKLTSSEQQNIGVAAEIGEETALVGNASCSANNDVSISLQRGTTPPDVATGRQPVSWTRNIQERLSKILSASKAVVIYNSTGDNIGITSRTGADKGGMQITTDSTNSRKVRMQILV